MIYAHPKFRFARLALELPAEDAIELDARLILAARYNRLSAVSVLVWNFPPYYER